MVLHVRLHTNDKKLLFVRTVQGHFGLFFRTAQLLSGEFVHSCFNCLGFRGFLFTFLGVVVKPVELLALEFCICQVA